jgi:hypothetical protein
VSCKQHAQRICLPFTVHQWLVQCLVRLAAAQMHALLWLLCACRSWRP